MRLAVILLALVAAVVGENIRVQSKVVQDQPSVLGFLKNVAIPAGEARKKAEQKYLRQSRIVGGSAAVSGQFPWQAGIISDIIGLEGNGVCGASLVTSTRLITAAHCWFDGRYRAWRFTVVLGSVFLFGNDGIRQQTSVVAVHPSWSPLLTRNDIAIIYLTQAVPFSNLISPVALPVGLELFQDYFGYQAVASGFGLTSDDGSITSNQFLNFVQVPVITNSECFWSYPLIFQISNVCTSGAGGQGTCEGDSGGPLVVISNNRPLLIGVTSFNSAFGCENGSPTVYARITWFIDFIHQHL